MNWFLNCMSLLWFAGAACYLLTLMDEGRRMGFGGRSRHDAGRHGRIPPQTEGTASGSSFHERF